MTVGTSLGLRQTIAFTLSAKDDRRYFLGLRQTLAYTRRAKDDHRYFSGTPADPSFHSKGYG